MTNMTANIYQFSCYREYLSKIVEVTKGTTAKISLSDLSESMSMHKSTFSKVMNFDMDLSADAVYLLTKFLKLNSD